jgi:hypothetical protein
MLLRSKNGALKNYTGVTCINMTILGKMDYFTYLGGTQNFLEKTLLNRLRKCLAGFWNP